MYLVGLHIYYKMIHGPYNVKMSDVVSVTPKRNEEYFPETPTLISYISLLLLLRWRRKFSPKLD